LSSFGNAGRVTSQEAIRQQIQGWTNVPLRQQFEAAERASRQSPDDRRKHDEIFKRTYGAWREEDGAAGE
jgi:hypothetical protein